MKQIKIILAVLLGVFCASCGNNITQEFVTKKQFDSTLSKLDSLTKQVEELQQQISTPLPADISNFTEMESEEKIVIVLADSISQRYLKELNAFKAKLDTIPPSMIWKSDYCIGLNKFNLASITKEVYPMDFDAYVSNKNENNEAKFWFRMTVVNKSPKANFPRTRICFTYNYEDNLGYLTERDYDKPGFGHPVKDSVKMRNEFESMLLVSKQHMSF